MRTGAVVAVVLAGLATWLALRERQERYVAGEKTEGLTEELARDLPDDRPAVRFTDVAAEAGLVFRHFPGTRAGEIVQDMGSGVALGDVDGDGWTDAFLMNADTDPEGARARLFRNRGDGGFEDVTDAAGVDVRGLGMAAAFVDVDGDRDLDLFTTSVGRCALFTNDGAGRFEDSSARAGVVGFDGFWSGVAVGDPDRDGDVDLYVCGYVRYVARAAGEKKRSQYALDIPAQLNPSSFEPERNLYFRNRGDGTFEEVAAELSIDDPKGRGLGALLADLTGDGWPDLYVANDVSDNAFLVNDREGGFVDRTTELLLGDYRGAMGLAVADFDADLDLDLYITHWVAQENALYVQMGRRGEDGELALRFMDQADAFGLGQVALAEVGWATRFFDYDLDGRLDLFTVNGSTIPLREDTAQLEPMRAHLYWSSPTKRGFYELGAVSGDFFGEEHVGRGGATFDYDLDGDEDLVVMRFGDAAALLRNDGAERNGALRLRLRQPTGNTFALGAAVYVTADGTTRYDVTDTQGSYLSQHAVGELAFGLGQAPEVERVEVVWPDGTRESLGPVLADSLVTWERGAAPRVELLPGERARGAVKPTTPALERRFFELREQATDARLAGELERAAALYADALALWPGHDDCLYYRAQCFTALGDEARALAVLERNAEYTPRSNRAWTELGRLRLPGGDPALDDLDAAAAAFERSHDINREESGPIVELGLVALLRDELEEADDLLARATTLNPRSVAAFYHRGHAAWLAGERERAAEHLAEAHRLAREASTAGGDSASSEGQTKSGKALLADESARPLAAHEGWRTLAEREPDAEREYGSAAR